MHSSRGLSGQIGYVPCCPLECTRTHIPHEEVLGRCVVVALWTARVCRTCGLVSDGHFSSGSLSVGSWSQLPSEFLFFCCSLASHVGGNGRSEALGIFNVANHFQAQDIRSVLRHTSTEVLTQEQHLRNASADHLEEAHHERRR